MITRYVIVESTSIDRLVLEVNALLRLGWIPQGGAAKNETHYIQAMVQLDGKPNISTGIPVQL